MFGSVVAARCPRALAAAGCLAVAMAGAAALMPAASAAAPPSVKAVSATTGTTSGGTVVTVSGANFSHVTSVLFGSRAGRSVKVLSSSRLRVSTPAHAAGTVDVRVRTATGTSAITTRDHFAFVAAPTITRISASSGTVAGGTRVTVTGTNFTHVSRVAFGATAGTSVRISSPHQLSVTSPAHTAGVVNISVSSSYGRSAGVAADRFSYLAPASIAGKVTIDGTGAPLPGVEVDAIDLNTLTETVARTAANGSYQLHGLTNRHQYFVCFDGSAAGPASATGYQDECWNNVSPFGTTAPTLLTVTTGHTLSVNAALAPGAAISGTITTSDKAAIHNLDVIVFTADGTPIDGTTTNSGAYTVKGIPPGTHYTICFDTSSLTGGAAHGYHDQCYAHTSWSGGDPNTGIADLPAGATTTSATTGHTTPGIDATLVANP